MIDTLFAKVESDFYLCLISDHHEQATQAIEKLKASLLEVEAHSELAKNYSTLFLEIFQFKATSCKSFWAQTPKLYSAVGEFIHVVNPYEEEFRQKIINLGLGQYLEIVE